MHLKKLGYRWIALLFFAGITLVSCDPSAIYDQSRKLPETGWFKDSVLRFSFEMADTLKPCNFYITVRNNDDYPYRNLYLFLSTQLPNQHVTRDTIELILANPEGKWIGKGFGALKDNRIPIRRNLLFPLKGNYEFRIEQAMREDYLLGISDIGIRVEHSE